MYNVELLPLIKEYQSGNQKQFEEVYVLFEKMFYFYANRLKHDDDAFQELNVFFVELLTRLPLQRFYADTSSGLHDYIAKSISNRYIAYSRKKQKEQVVSYCEEIAADEDSFERYEYKIVLSEGMTLLTEKQKKVIFYKYVQEYSDVEISELLHISRQAVNRLKIRGLSTLREYLKD